MGREGREDSEVGPSNRASPWNGYSLWECAQDWAGALRWPHGSLPPILDSGNQKPYCFFPSECCPLSWGSWQVCCWPVGWRHMGSGAWHFFRDSHCLFLVRLSSCSHAPPQPVPAIPLSPALGRAKVLGGEIDRSLPPTRLLCWDPQ